VSVADERGYQHRMHVSASARTLANTEVITHRLGEWLSIWMASRRLFEVVPSFGDVRTAGMAQRHRACSTTDGVTTEV
jgi:hypothetical protein